MVPIRRHVPISSHASWHEKVTIQLIDTPTKVYAIGAKLFLSKVPLEVLQNWVLTIGVRGVFLQGEGYFPAQYVAGLLQLCRGGGK